MKKINLKKVNKNTLCNVLIAVNVGTLVLNLINKKRKKAKARKEAINDVIDYVDNRFDEQHYEGTWKMPDGDTVKTDVGYAEEWWKECMKKELEFK
jgi:hypothetical protein